MKILGLDMSTKTGYAVLADGVLTSMGLLKEEPVTIPGLAEDYSVHRRAVNMAEKVWQLVNKERPDLIVIEQTNAGRFRSSQKQLEFIHCLVLQALLLNGFESRVRYVDTSAWRSALSIKLTKEQRKHNKLVKAKSARGKVTPKHLAVSHVNQTFGLSLKMKDNDIADAICLAEYGQVDLSRPKPGKIDVEQVLKTVVS